MHLGETELGTHPQETFGCLLIFVSAVCFAAMQMLSRLATDYHGFPESGVTGMQGLTMAIFAFAGIMSSKDARAHALHTYRGDLPFVLLQGFVGGAARALIIAALTLIPLVTETSLLLPFPIVAIGMSAVLLGETFGAFELVATLVCFAGVVLVSNPTLQIDLSQIGHSSYLYGCVIAVLASWCLAAQLVIIKAYTKRVHYLVSAVSMGVWTMLLGVTMGGADPEPLLETSMRTGIVILSCIFGAMSQCFMSKGSEYCRAGMGAVVLNVILPISYLLGIIFLAEMPSFVSLFGATLAFTAALLMSCKQLITQTS